MRLSMAIVLSRAVYAGRVEGLMETHLQLSDIDGVTKGSEMFLERYTLHNNTCDANSSSVWVFLFYLDAYSSCNPLESGMTQ